MVARAGRAALGRAAGRQPVAIESSVMAHSHGLVDDSIKRSRAGVRAVTLALVVLGLTAAAQAFVLVISGSVALLADLIHNAGDALTAVPLGVAFALRSPRAERWAGLFVVAAIFVSACVAGYEAVDRLISPQDVEHLGALAAAGAVGFAGNWAAARDPQPRRPAPGQPGADRRRRPRAGGRLREPGRRRERGQRRRRPAGRRSADRPGHHAGDPAHHLAVLADARRLTIITRSLRTRNRGGPR